MDWTRLTELLRACPDERVELDHAEVARLVGGPLPASSARAGYWVNTTTRAQAWTDAGYRATRRGLGPDRVAFVRADGVPRRTFGADTDADRLVRTNPFAFLLGALLDHGIDPDRAWRGPLELRRRLGHLDPTRMVDDPDAVRAAVAGPPALHRYRETVATWLVEAARRVVADDGGDASALWSDEPTRAVLRERLVAFPGMGEVKAARTVAALEHDLGVRLHPDGPAVVGGDGSAAAGVPPPAPGR